MALVYMDSCGDFYATGDLAKRWDTLSGVPVVGASTGRRGGGGITLGSTSDRLQKNVPALTSYVAGGAFKVDSLVATDLLTFREGTTDHVIVRLTATGAIQVLRAPSTQLAISAGGLVFAGDFFYVEAKILVNDSTGTVDVDLNGTNIITLTSQDTANGGTPTIDNVELEGSAGTLTVDDFYILDTTGAAPQNDRLGDTAVYAVLPQADGATNNFPVLEPSTPTTSFDKVDDTNPDGDGSYVASDSSGDLELFDLDPLPDPGGTSSIYSVQLNLCVRKDKVTSRSVQGVARQGGTNYLGTVQNTESAYSYKRQIWDEDPDAAADWTEAGVNSAEFGMQIV